MAADTGRRLKRSAIAAPLFIPLLGSIASGWVYLHPEQLKTERELVMTASQLAGRSSASVASRNCSKETPLVETRILQTQRHISGIGEPGTPPAAPALANAIFDLTGERHRNLPLNRAVDFRI